MTPQWNVTDGRVHRRFRQLVTQDADKRSYKCSAVGTINILIKIILALPIQQIDKSLTVKARRKSIALFGVMRRGIIGFIIVNECRPKTVYSGSNFLSNLTLGFCARGPLT